VTAHITPLSLSDLAGLPTVVDIPTAGRILGVTRDHAYRLAAAGEFPVPVFMVGRRYRVAVPAMLALLGATPELVAALLRPPAAGDAA
jgi:predicted DNA-binding transcriptional regulator AlpA